MYASNPEALHFDSEGSAPQAGRPNGEPEGNVDFPLAAPGPEAR